MVRGKKGNGNGNGKPKKRPPTVPEQTLLVLTHMNETLGTFAKRAHEDNTLLRKEMRDGFAAMGRKMDEGFTTLGQKIDDGFATMGQKIDSLRETMTFQYEDLSARVRSLEADVTELKRRALPPPRRA